MRIKTKIGEGGTKHKTNLRMPGLFRNIDRARLMKGELESLYIPEHSLPSFQFFPL